MTLRTPLPGPRGAGAPAARPLRADAERNRQQVLLAARAVFARRGLSAGLNDVAREAGLGVGTVYRRFPSKDALVAEALAGPCEDVLGTARAALEADDAWAGLVQFLERASDLLAANLGLRQLALGESPDGGAPGGGPLARLRSQVQPLAEELLDRARVAGALREGAGAPDVLVALCALTEVARHAAPARPLLHRRYLQVLLDGLRARAEPGGQPRLVEPLDDAEAAALAARWTAAG